jgi:uncharacterized protein YciW
VTWLTHHLGSLPLALVVAAVLYVAYLCADYLERFEKAEAAKPKPALTEGDIEEHAGRTVADLEAYATQEYLAGRRAGGNTEGGRS